MINPRNSTAKKLAEANQQEMCYVKENRAEAMILRPMGWGSYRHESKQKVYRPEQDWQQRQAGPGLELKEIIQIFPM